MNQTTRTQKLKRCGQTRAIKFSKLSKKLKAITTDKWKNRNRNSQNTKKELKKWQDFLSCSTAAKMKIS